MISVVSKGTGAAAAPCANSGWDEAVLQMKPPPFSYHDPKTVSEVIGLLSTLENAKLLAGGQSLMPMLNFRFVQPDHIIDLNRVEGLSYIRDTADGMEVGAMTRQRDLEFSELVERKFPLM